MQSVTSRPPFWIDAEFVRDADNDVVLWCGDLAQCSARYKGAAIDAAPHFICPKCGRLGLRMEEAPPRACGLPFMPC